MLADQSQIAAIEAEANELATVQRGLVAEAEAEAADLAERIAEIQERKASFASQLSMSGAGGGSIAAAARFTPWQSRCLIQVLAAQRLLAKRKIPGQFHLGVQRDSGSIVDPTGFSAHAWLQCGDVIVTGAAGHERFTVVSSFSWGGLNG